MTAHMSTPFRFTAVLALLIASCGDDSGSSSTSKSMQDRLAEQEGFWYVARDDAAQTAQMQSEIAKLGYADGYVASGGDTGVLLADKRRVQPGYNLYSSGHGSEAFLFDVEGKTVHGWSFDYEDIPNVRPMEHPSQIGWRRVRMLEDGSLLAIHGGLVLLKLDVDSNLVWVHSGGEHHDLEVAPDGRIVTLTRRPGELADIIPGERIVDESLTILSAAGEELQSISLFDAFRGTPWFVELQSVALAKTERLKIAIEGDLALDILHSNSVQVLDGRHTAVDLAFADGNVLVCLREMNAFVVIDPKTSKVAWFLQGPWVYPHDARLIDSGALTLFDNRGNGGYSRVTELTYPKGEFSWSYQGDPPESFFSVFCGVARRLENGNTLMTESCNGRALEVTSGGDVVWAFRSPHRAGEAEEFVAVLFEVERIPEASVLPWLRSR